MSLYNAAENALVVLREYKNIDPGGIQGLNDLSACCDRAIDAIEDLLRAAAERDPELAELVDGYFETTTAENGGCSCSSGNGGCSCSENGTHLQCQCKKETESLEMVFEDLGNSEMQLTMGNVRITWERIGEGICGDYNPDDSDDEELLRFSVYKKDEGNWCQVDGASYCTNFPAVGPTDEQKKLALKTILEEVYKPLIAGSSIESMCEVLSYISPEWLKDKEGSAEANEI